MDPVTLGAVLLAVATGVSEALGGQLWAGVVSLVRRPLHYDQAPVQPGQALDALLRALGMPGDHVPEGAEERAGFYRSALAQIKDPVLIVADNASTEAQVRLLIPGPGPHRVIITSRHTLAGLGARLLNVTVLDQAASVGLLERVLGAARPGDDRINRDHAAADRLADICGGLPLALRITAALLVGDLALTTRELANRLAGEAYRLAGVSGIS